ncbi:MAG: serine protease [Fuerstiella sp.]
MRQIFLTICLLIAALTPVASLGEDNVPERWDRAVCLHSPGANPESDNFASGFVVDHSGSLFLVTAGHAAQQSQRTSRLRFRCLDGTSQWASLAILFPSNGNPWVRNQSSDIAIALIADSGASKPYHTMLAGIAIPIENLVSDVPRRTTQVEVAGFPFGFGIKPDVKPLVAMTRIASSELEAKNQWGTEPIVYAFPAIAQGTSGGPAFLNIDDPRNCVVIGMYVGVCFDASGGKLSKLVPSSVIRDAIKAQSKPESGG